MNIRGDYSLAFLAGVALSASPSGLGGWWDTVNHEDKGKEDPWLVMVQAKASRKPGPFGRIR